MREYREGTADHDGRHDGEAIQAIGEVYGITGSHDDKVGECHKPDQPQGYGDLLEKWHDHGGLRGQLGGQDEVQCSEQGYQRLPEELRPGGKSLGVAIDYLAVVIRPADHAEPHCRYQHYPYVPIAQIRPQKRGNGDRYQYQRAAHGRRARFDEMRLGTVVPYRLSDLVCGKLPYHRWPDDERNRQRRQRRQNGPQRDIVEHIEKTYVFAKPLGKF